MLSKFKIIEKIMYTPLLVSLPVTLSKSVYSTFQTRGGCMHSLDIIKRMNDSAVKIYRAKDKAKARVNALKRHYKGDFAPFSAEYQVMGY
jgi:hypothetical protein